MCVCGGGGVFRLEMKDSRWRGGGGVDVRFKGVQMGEM